MRPGLALGQGVPTTVTPTDLHAALAVRPSAIRAAELERLNRTGSEALDTKSLLPVLLD